VPSPTYRQSDLMLAAVHGLTARLLARSSLYRNSVPASGRLVYASRYLHLRSGDAGTRAAGRGTTSRGVLSLVQETLGCQCSHQRPHGPVKYCSGRACAIVCNGSCQTEAIRSDVTSSDTTDAHSSGRDASTRPWCFNSSGHPFASTARRPHVDRPSTTRRFGQQVCRLDA
jgi:hypothetical protein